MIKLLRFLKNYKKESVLGPLFKLLEATLELFIPTFIANVIDKGIAEHSKQIIITQGILMICFGLIGFVFSVIAQYFSAKAAVGFVTEIRTSLYKKIQDFSYSQLDKIGTSSLITKMTSDTNQIQSTVNLALRLLLRSPFIVIGTMIMAFTIDFKSGLVFVIVIPILSVVVFGIMIVLIPLYKKVQEAIDNVLGKTRENLSGIRVIRAFNKQTHEINEFDECNSILTREQKLTGRISALMNPITYLIVNIGIIVLIYVGALQVNKGNLSQGDVIALYNHMTMILVELVKLAMLIITITKGFACGNRIQSIFEMESGETTAQTSNKSSDENIIEFKDVSYRYEGSNENSLSNISFSIKQGEILGIIGGTGSGKTTLINLLPRFYETTEGTIYFNGEDINTIDVTKLRDQIGLVPQKPVLFKGTIRSNLKWGNEDATDEELIEAIKLAQGIDILNKKTDGLDATVEQGGKNFSGGQKQRLTIARALVRKPKILILDDSSSALDFATSSALQKALNGLDYNPTIIIVSQRTSAIACADKIIVLDNGEAVGIGTHTSLKKNCEVYQEIYNSQFKKEDVVYE